MAGRCKRTTQVRSAGIAAGDTVDLVLQANTVEYTLRVVDATTYVGVAFTFAYLTDPLSIFHFQAGESYQEAKIGPVAGPFTIRLGAAVAARAELIVWED